MTAGVDYIPEMAAQPTTLPGGRAHAQHATRQTTPELAPPWRDYFLRLLRGSRRIEWPRRFLRQDLLETMRRLIPGEARILEVGVGSGALLAGLPNRVRHGIDALEDAVDSAARLDPAMHVSLGDALTYRSADKYDAVICDRLVHSVSDVQSLLTNVTRLLEDEGRIYLTCFNFLWSVPLMIGDRIGMAEPSPPQNWLSESDLVNLFALADLEPVRFEDRVLLPAPVPLLSNVLNRVGAHLPVTHYAAMYRVYVLRKRKATRPPPKVTVVIPARNEAGNIARAVNETPVMGRATEVIFVEGGSSDGTYEKIEEVMRDYRGPLELKLYRQQGKGKGDAVRVGFKHATGDLLMILDADLTVPPEDLPKFYDAMVSGITDYIQGTRLVYPMEDEAMRFLNKIGNAFFAKTFSFLLDQLIKDTLCGTKVLWRADYDRIAANREVFGDFDPFGDFDLIFGASRLNLKIMELPVRYRNRTYGETNIQRFRDGLLLLRMSLLAARKIKFI
jgi:2-polyprenyl-3-methyl-5-hydroxy-6-metoxy-1,4-benzoquinol methylase